MTPPADGRLAENIVHFARALRKAGVRVGPAQVTCAIEAVEAAGFTKRVDFRETLRATLITRAEHLALFDQTFEMFWRDPDYLNRMIHMLSPLMRKDEEEEAEAKKKAAAARRAGRGAKEAARETPRPVSPGPPRRRDCLRRPCR